MPQPQTSTLFPYTTLFRSMLEPYMPAGRHPKISFGWILHKIFPFDKDFSAKRNFTISSGFIFRIVFCLQPFHLDRKSTRLNSSHVAISYAVFYLKKKT